MNIYEYAEAIGAKVKITGELSADPDANNYINAELVRDSKSLKVINDGTLIGAFGRSTEGNVDQAIQDLCRSIVGKQICFESSDLSFKVPQLNYVPASSVFGKPTTRG